MILWHADGASPARLAAARRLGVTAARVFGARAELSDAALAAELGRAAAPARAAGLSIYLENIATDFYAAYHRWRPDRPVSFAFDQVQARHQSDRADPSVFMREPSLSDPVWLARIAARLAAHARAARPARPLFYSLGDETGIADLAAAWDFDRSPASLAAFRAWLRRQYGSLAALNAEWGTGFADWDAVRPLTTDAALARSLTAISPPGPISGLDGRRLRDALRAGTGALHAATPPPAPASRARRRRAPAATTISGWPLRSTCMEISDGAPPARLARALNPALVPLTTIGGGGGGDAAPVVAGAARRRPRRGAVGPAAASWSATDGDARAARARAGAAARRAARPGRRRPARRPAAAGPVAILYSPASFRAGWLLDRRAEAARGADWSRRRAETKSRTTRRLRGTAPGGRGAGASRPGAAWLTPVDAGRRRLARRHARAAAAAGAGAVGRRAWQLRASPPRGGRCSPTAPGGFDAHGRRRAGGGRSRSRCWRIFPPPRSRRRWRRRAWRRLHPHPPGRLRSHRRHTRVLRQGGATSSALQRDLRATGRRTGRAEAVAAAPDRGCAQRRRRRADDPGSASTRSRRHLLRLAE